MRKLLLITALLALMSLDVNAGGNHHRRWFNWFPRWEQAQRERERSSYPTPVNVPDDGATATLLGLACAGIFIIHRKIRP